MRRLLRNTSGAAAVEFAIVLPVLVAVLMGTIEFGLILYSKNALQSVARDVARQLAVNTLGEDQVDLTVKNSLPKWIKSSAKAKVLHSNKTDVAKNVITVTVSVAASQAGIIGYYTRITGDWTLNGSAAMKQEDRV